MGCHGRRRRHRPREADLALAYARGEIDRDAFLARSGGERAYVDLKNRISILREKRTQLRARLRELEARATTALEREGLLARELFEEKIALAEALAATERDLAEAESALRAWEATHPGGARKEGSP